jgi:hypothetical protein
MAIEIGTINADTVVKLGSTTIQSGYIGFNQFYNTYTSILDLYPSAYHAYSLRKLKSTYTGFCLRIRRTTTTPTVTTTTVDLKFDVFNTISMNSAITVVSGLGTTSAKTLSEFAIGTVDGFTAHSEIKVVTWYDQSGNNKNVTQTNANLQPRLVRLDTGVATLETSVGKTSVRFTSGSSQGLILNDTSVPLNNVSSYVVGNPITTTSTNFFSLSNLTTSRYNVPGANTISYISSGTFTGMTITAGVNRLYELICGTLTTSAYSNGTILSPSSVTSSILSNNRIRLGVIGSSGFDVYSNGYISEAISFVGASNRNEIESNINTYYSIYV